MITRGNNSVAQQSKRGKKVSHTSLNMQFKCRVIFTAAKEEILFFEIFKNN
jgi:hypothetical protein